MNRHLFYAVRLLLLTLLLGRAAACPDADAFMVLPNGRIHGGRHSSLRAAQLNSTDVTKRYLRIIPFKPGNGDHVRFNDFGELWPDNTIPWCFSPDISAPVRQTLRLDLNAAWNLWVAAGIDRRQINFKEGNPVECSVRSDYLLVNVSTTKMATTLGKINTPTMTLALDPTFGFGDRIANFAHEIGHAFGLLHEHQRPDHWDRPFGGSARANTFIFHCANVADYAQRTAGMTQAEIDAMCHSRTESAVNRFNGKEFLPFTKFVTMGGPFDDKSIMLYTSRTGGLVVNGVKLVVYTLANGNEIVSRHSPSPTDVENLRQLYPAAEPQQSACLPFQNCSPFQALFRTVTGCMTRP